jgi:hypothetical protein
MVVWKCVFVQVLCGRSKRVRMKYRRALIMCAKCKRWSGWISRTKGGVKRIDTRCSCCGSRLRHTEHPDKDRQFINCYRPGRGAHNRSQSVFKFIPCTSNIDVKREAARRNARGQFDKAEYLDRAMTFVKAKDWDDVRLK